jgi:hypothetical protein
MTYTVVWKPEAERRLATLWTEAADRKAITEAANAIDDWLRSDPESRGESRGDGRRILLEPPLGVVFSVQPEDRTVIVLTVWLVKPLRRD